MPLWETANIRGAIQFDGTMRESKLFTDFPFAPDAAQYGLRNKKLAWTFYGLTKTYDRPRNRRYMAAQT